MLIVALFFLSSNGADGKSNNAKFAEPFINKAGGFSVMFASRPSEKTLAIGKLSVTRFVAEAKGDVVQVVSYTDYPENDVKKDGIQKRLDQARDGAAASVNGRVIAEKSILIGDHPGRDVTIEKAGSVAARMRIVVVRNRLYQVLAVGPPAGLGSKDTTAFIESFRLLK